MKTKPLARRTLLRGAGVALGLPVLEGMLDRRGLTRATAWAAPAKAPVRLVFVMFPDGVEGARGDSGDDLRNWTPPGEGTDYGLTPALEPLSPVKGDVSVVSQLRNTAFYVREFFGSDCHKRGMTTMLTGVPITAKGAGGPSVDQVAAKELGGQTRLPSLQVAVESSGGTAHDKFASWAGRDQPLPGVENPAILFKMLFGAGGSPAPAPGQPAAAADPFAAHRKSVLDFVRADAARLQRVVGMNDRNRLDAFLTSVRDVEKQIFGVGGQAPAAPASTACSTPGSAPASPPDYRARMDALMKLTVLGLQCDQTRFVTFQFGRAGSSLSYPWLGIKGGDHDLSHVGGANYARITRWKVEMFAKFVQMFKDAPDAGGSLLDNTLMSFTSDCGIGQGHACHSMPVLLAGRGGMQVRSGRHLRHSRGTPLNRLYLSMLRAAGSRATKFGTDGSEPLSLA